MIDGAGSVDLRGRRAVAGAPSSTSESAKSDSFAESASSSSSSSSPSSSDPSSEPEEPSSPDQSSESESDALALPALISAAAWISGIVRGSSGSYCQVDASSKHTYTTRRVDRGRTRASLAFLSASLLAALIVESLAAFLAAFFWALVSGS